MQEYEDGLCDGCGQPLRDTLDDDLRDYWTTANPHRCGGCNALAEAHEASEQQGRKHLGALRYVVGLREGWQERRSAARAERAAASEPRHQAEHGHQRPQ